MAQGPNFKKLVILKMSKDAVPEGSGPMALAHALRFIATKGAIGEAAKAAQAWCEQAIQAIRNAKDPNPWRHADDEAIAADLIEQIEMKKHSRKKAVEESDA